MVKENINIFGIVCFICLGVVFFWKGVSSAELRLDSVSPNQGVLGENLEVVIKGSGFDHNTRISMSRNANVDGGVKSPFVEVDNASIGGAAMCMINETAYLTDYDGNLIIMDLGNPLDPILIGKAKIADTNLNYWRSMTVVNDIAYMLSSTNFYTLNVAKPSEAKGLASLPIDSSLYNKLCVLNGLAYLTGERGVQIIDVRDPSEIKLMSFVETPKNTTAVAIEGETVFVGAGLDLHIIDVSDAGNPQIISSINIGKNISNIIAEDQKIYVSTFNPLIVIDVKNPFIPQIIGSINTFDYVPGGYHSDVKGFVKKGDLIWGVKKLTS